MWSPIFFAAALIAAIIITTSWLLVSLRWRWWWRPKAARRHDVARRTFLATAFGTATEETTIPVPLPGGGTTTTTIHVPLIRLAAAPPPRQHNAPPPPPVLFVHGIGSSAAMVLSSPAAQALRAQQHDVYAMDMPGLVVVSSSSSSCSDDAFVAMSADECLAAYAAVFDQVLGHIIVTAATTSAPIIVAHSLGAFLASETFLGARRCCGRQQQKPAGLVLVSPAGVLPTLGLFGPLWALFFRLGLPGAVLRPIAKLWLLFFLPTAVATGMSRTQYWWHVQAAAPRANVAAKFMAFAAAVTGVVVWTRPQLANILQQSSSTLPVALIWGAADALAPMSSATMKKLFAADAHQEKVAVMPGVGHSVLQHPDSGPVLRRAVARLAAVAAAVTLPPPPH